MKQSKMWGKRGRVVERSESEERILLPGMIQFSFFFYFYGRVAGFKVASQNVVENKKKEKKRRHFSEPPPSLNFDKSSLRGLKLNCAAAGASSEALILAPPLSTQTALVKQSLKQVFLEITAPVKWLPHPPPPPPNASPLPSHHPHKLPSLFFEGQRGWMDVISFKCSTRSILTARRIFYFFPVISQLSIFKLSSWPWISFSAVHSRSHSPSYFLALPQMHSPGLSTGDKSHQLSLWPLLAFFVATGLTFPLFIAAASFLKTFI